MCIRDSPRSPSTLFRAIRTLSIPSAFTMSFSTTSSSGALISVSGSLPAIALGLEPHKHEVMKEKPRPMNESILTKTFLGRVGMEGAVIGLVTLGAFFVGYQGGNAKLASTMAFGVLCLSRLFHGYSCKGKAPVLFTKRFFNNKYMQMAFLAGFVLLTAVLTIPALHGMFAVQTLTLVQLFTVYGLAFGSMVIVQLLKWVMHRK